MNFVFLLIFCSGFAGLVYEVLWMKQLGLLFGNTSHAAGATLAAFFGGLAIGSWLWGRRAARMKNPLRTYACFQVGIAVAAGLYFFVLRGYYAVYPLLYQRFGSDWWLLAVKFALALVLVLPPSIFMGGTIPVIGHYMIRSRSAFGRTAALLYGTNTLGAALGAFMAGFYLPLWFGFRITFIGAMTINCLVAATAFWLSRKYPYQAVPDTPAAEAARQDKAGIPVQGRRAIEAQPDTGRRWAVFFVCFLSGFGFLALEVLWTRMFMQVLENSVYTFATILVIVLLCLAAGAFVSSRLARLKFAPLSVLAILLLVSGLAVALTPFIFMEVTDSLQIFVVRGSWARYVLMVFKKGFMAIGLPALLLGTVFPFLMKTEERYMLSAGKSLGHLAAVNTTGAILGALICGFVLLEILGMWGTMRLMVAAYAVAVIILPLAWNVKGVLIRTAGGALLIMAFTGLDATRLPIINIASLPSQDNQILEIRETTDGTVAVVSGSSGLKIVLNSNYVLGSTGAFEQEKLQAEIPLMAYPETASIFFLGMGTGITAGSALDPRFEQVKRVVACEIVPEVIAAAKKYFTNYQGHDFTGGLFDDPRATILAEDGRHYLMATGEQFDMVNGDLFVPFRSGIGSLYTKEHFQNVKNRLAPEGIFFQWIPLYQMTESEFSIIARTMLEVFDTVSLWRNNFQPGHEVVALAGHKGSAPLPPSDIESNADMLRAVAGKNHRDMGRLELPFNPNSVLFFYCGNVSEASELFADYPVNTDDRPVIEYMAPRTYRSKTDAAIPWFVGPRLARLVEEMQKRCPPESDPLLVNRTAANRRLPAAGAAYHRGRIWQVIGDQEKSIEAWRQFLEAWLWETGDAAP